MFTKLSYLGDALLRILASAEETNMLFYNALWRRDEARSNQWWANLDQASKHLEVFRFRDLSPTPIP
jgi:hypothetical protein